MDDLGNRTKVNLRSGSDETYVVDDDTNRYTSIGGSNLTYDDAGNLTTDKDGYQYEYDYENRIVKITDVNDVDVATFAYDALGRRVRKIDSKASETTYYFHNDKWQVFAEFDGDDDIKRWYVYGNYIDEVLFSPGVGGNYYYLHDHLYSPVALVNGSGTVIERYEYDAYGNCNILEADFTADPDGISDDNNPYYFTGRRLDTLDNGNLEVMYYRNRSYDTYAGRFLQHDPLGIRPAGGEQNPFRLLGQYNNRMNLYEYVGSRPTVGYDPFGLYKWEAPDPAGLKSWMKALCKILAPIPHFNCGAKALEGGWCNKMHVACVSFCNTDDEVDEFNQVPQCIKKCSDAHNSCLANASKHKCSFEFKIKG